MPRGPRVLQVGTQRGVGQPGAAVELVILQLREYAKALRIAFEVEEVVALGFAHRIEPATARCLVEPVADRVFTRMPEGRIADVMGQAR